MKVDHPPSPENGFGGTGPPSPENGFGGTGPPSPENGFGETGPPSPENGFGETGPPSPENGFGETGPPSPESGFGETGPPSPENGFAGTSPPPRRDRLGGPWRSAVTGSKNCSARRYAAAAAGATRQAFAPARMEGSHATRSNNSAVARATNAPLPATTATRGLGFRRRMTCLTPCAI